MVNNLTGIAPGAETAAAVTASRKPEFDICKGILMVLVVLGHSGFSHSDIIYWFHMPLFFIISCYFFRSSPTKEDVYRKMKKVTVEILVPYLAYLLVLNLPLLVSSLQVSGNAMAVQALKLLYGGKYLHSTNGTFWFMSVLLLTRLAFSLLSYYLPFRALTVTMVLSYAVAVSESYWLHATGTSANFPLNCDVVLFALPFYYIGHLLHRKSLLPGLVAAVVATAVSCVFVYLHLRGTLYFKMDMKYEVYYRPVLCLVLPLLAGAIFYNLSLATSYLRYFGEVLGYIGRNSLTVMYLHIFVNAWLFQLIGIRQNIGLFMLFGLGVPMALNFFIRKSTVARRVFIGN